MRGGDGEKGGGEGEEGYSRRREMHMKKSGNSRELGTLRAISWTKL